MFEFVQGCDTRFRRKLTLINQYLTNECINTFTYIVHTWKNDWNQYHFTFSNKMSHKISLLWCMPIDWFFYLFNHVNKKNVVFLFYLFCYQISTQNLIRINYYLGLMDFNIINVFFSNFPSTDLVFSYSSVP
jgi:hypothetical protein